MIKHLRSGVSGTDLTDHAADTTSVHGITNTATLVTSPDVTVIDVVTQAAYDALGGGVSATTLYVIVG